MNKIKPKGRELHQVKICSNNHHSLKNPCLLFLYAEKVTKGDENCNILQSV